jgi:hypothetical protein
MSSYTNLDNTSSATIVTSSNEHLTGYKWAIAGFLSASYTYDVVEATKYYANKAWDYLLDFTKIFVETQYVEKTSDLAFVVDGAVEKLHEFGNKNINSTIDLIIAKMDDLVDPTVHHYHPHPEKAVEKTILGVITEASAL